MWGPRQDCHSETCDRLKRTPTGCPCGFTARLLQGPRWPSIPSGEAGPYVAARSKEPGVLQDLSGLLASPRERSRQANGARVE